jgi:hypothetical protein
MPLGRRAFVLVVALLVAGCTSSTGVGAPRPSVESPGPIPPTARSLVVTYQRYVPQPAQRYGPVTVTDPALIAAVTGEANALPLGPYGPRPCPVPSSVLQLSFRSAAGDEVAHVQASMSGCDDISVDLRTTGTLLSGAGTLTRFVLATLRLSWGTA